MDVFVGVCRTNTRLVNTKKGRKGKTALMQRDGKVVLAYLLVGKADDGNWCD